MPSRNSILMAFCAIAAVCLIKVAFFPSASNGPSLLPNAFADGGVIEWKDAMRIVTAGDNGATTYVWDYEGKTKVRKYSIRGGKLVLEIFTLDK